MVSKKRLHYGGLDGFQTLVVPKAPRSLRRNARKKPSPGSEICAFDLLATVAGELLQESESSVSSTGPERKEQISIPIEGIKQEPLEVKLSPSRLDYLDQGSCGESEFVPELSLKNLQQSVSDSGLDHASDFLKKVSTDVKSEASNGENGTNGDLCDVQMDTNETKVQIDAVDKQSEDLTAVKSCVNQLVLDNSCNSVHLPLYSNNIPSACTPRPRNSVKIGIREDDDENPCSFNHHCTKMRAFKLQSHARYRRIRKMLTATKHWKSAPKLKDYEPLKTTSPGVNPFDHIRKNRYMRDRCQGENACKRRKLFHHSSKPDHVQETSSESISNLPKAKAGTSSITNHKSSFHSEDGQLKFSIKSFNIPELYVEMPETSTIGSLKATVMEALTAILGGELHVGVHLQGNKIKDDSITLQQSGISLDSDALGFMLEPGFLEDTRKEPPLLSSCDNHELLASSPVSPVANIGSLNSSLDPSLATSLENQSNQESKEVPTEEIVDTKAIAPVTPLNPQALSIVPASHNGSKRSELSQRRTRRPFSVSEVEALVEAVETLGTGRWRDVKIRAFDDANHRTYVDLKDKWKTLVHTASISPQQRRGEPVPQGLLDRVLAAHSMWSQPSSKPHGSIRPHQTDLIQTPPVQVCLEL